MENKNANTILVVEDQKDMGDFLSTLLERQGYRVQVVPTGVEGIQMAQHANVALVLLDLMLPDVDGFEVCLKIKEKRPRLPVIMLTVRNELFDVVTGLDSGANDYVTKPFANAVLLARVRAALRASQWREVTPRPVAPIRTETQRHALEMLSFVSHELRTPVAAIKGFITTMLSNHRYWADDEREAFLESVNQSADQLSRLVENVLEMGRLDQGLRLHKRPVRLTFLVQRALYEFSLRAARCEFVNEVPADLPMVMVDPLRMERVLYNLVENAVKFSSQRGRVRVFAQVKAPYIEVGVEDQGIGIAAQDLPHIFKPFYQVERNDLSREGIGLGLSIVKELVEAHKGRVWVESCLGAGTTFFFTLPLETERLDFESSRPVHPTTYRSVQHQGTILIVEDDPQMLKFLRLNLEAQGFEVLTTSLGMQAIEWIEAKAPDLVLLDLRLPDLDGLSVCERVRCFSNIPIILVTGQASDSSKVQGLALGADDYIVKPFSIQELLARSRAVLRRTRVSNGSERLRSLSFDGFEIDPLCYEVKTPRGSTNLTPTEHKLMYYLASNAGQVLTHQQILTQVWGYEWDNQTQYLWVNISRLRKKIEPDPSDPRYILTEPGIGYRFAKPAKST